MPVIQTTKPLRKRNKLDYYPTPPALAEAALRLLTPPTDYALVLDPGAGTGVWGQAWRTVWGDPLSLTGVDLVPATPWPAGYDLWYTEDFLHSTLRPPYDYIIGNPPYGLAEAFVRTALGLLTPRRGVLLFLLRLEFLASQTRGRGLFAAHPPAVVHVCVSRPSFTGDGKTDAMEYGLFEWRAGYTGPTVLDWCDWKAPAGAGQLRLLEAVA